MKQRPQRKSRTIKAIDIFAQASRFSYADRFIRRHDLNPQEIYLMSGPSMVLSAFAIELFLKCLLHMERGCAPNTHRLNVLYRQISNKRKRRIEELWAAHVNENSRDYDLAPYRKTPMPKDLIGCLRECRDAFQLLRYAYEDPDKQLFYLGELPEILRRAILEFNPDWPVAR